MRYMPNDPAIEKRVRSFQLPLELHQQLVREAARLGVKVNSLLVLILTEELDRRGVELTPEDYEEIAKQKRKNQRARAKKRAGT